MKKFLARPVLWLLTCAFPVFIAACYGAYEEGMGIASRYLGKVVDALSGDGIGQIKVSCTDAEGNPSFADGDTYTLTEDGSFYLTIAEGEICEGLLFEDVDGEENGGTFASKLVMPFPEGQETDVQLEQEN